MAKVNDKFGQAVRDLIEKHNLSLRGAALKAGLDHVTVSKMASGYPPQREIVMRWARGFNEDARDWLEFAGYERDDTGLSGADRLVDGIINLQKRYPDRDIPIPRLLGSALDLSFEEAEKVLRSIEADLKATEKRGAATLEARR